MDELNKRALLKRAIYLCWLLLGLSLLIKLFGGNFFEPYTDNAKFLALCEFIDTNTQANIILGILLSFSSTSLFWLATARQRWYKSDKELLICLVSVFIGSPCRLLIHATGIFFDVVYHLFIPVYMLGGFTKTNLKRTALSFATLLIFMVLCNVIKDLPAFGMTCDDTFTGLLCQIDLYIMLSLYYLYSNTESAGDQDGLDDESFLREV